MTPFWRNLIAQNFRPFCLPAASVFQSKVKKRLQLRKTACIFLPVVVP